MKTKINIGNKKEDGNGEMWDGCGGGGDVLVGLRGGAGRRQAVLRVRPWLQLGHGLCWLFLLQG